MDIISRLEHYRGRNAVASGPEGPRYVAKGLVDRYPGLNLDDYRRNHLIGAQLELAVGATITACVLNRRGLDSHDPLLLHMPIFHHRIGPDMAINRHEVVCALLCQQVAHLKVLCCNLVGAAILLGRMQPAAAWRMLTFDDGQSRAYSLFACEFLLGLPLYAGKLVREAAGRGLLRVLSACV